MENWFEDYRQRVKINRAIGLVIALTPVAFYLMAWVFSSVEVEITSIIMTFIAIIFAPSMLLSCNKYRRYNGHLIVLYIAPIKNYLIIDGVLQSEGGPFQHDYYGELPSGEQVHAKLGSFGNVKFAIGNFDNKNIQFF